MKKVKLLLALFMAFTGLSAGHAQTIATTPVNSGSEIQAGYYVIRTNKKIENGNNFITAKDNYVKWIKTTNITDNLIWKIEGDATNGYYMKNVATQQYIGGTTTTGTATSPGSTVCTMVASEQKQSINITYLGNTDEGGYQYKIKNNGCTFHCEASGYNEAYVVSWDTGLDQASAWCFEQVTDQSAAQELDNQYAGNVSAITIQKQDDKGVTFETLSLIVPRNEVYTIPSSEDFYTWKSTTVDNVDNQNNSFTPNAATHNIVCKYTYNLPFTSTEINSDAFPENTHWYLLKVRENRYVKYNADDHYLYVTAADDKGYGDEYWWAFSGDYQNGIKVYNKAAGTSMILRSVTPTGDGGSTNPQMAESASEDATLNKEWTIYPSTLISGENAFYLSRKDETTKLSHYGGGNNVKLAFYTYTDIGSAFTVVSLENEKAAVSGYAPENIFAVGTLVESARSEYTSSLNANSPDGLRKAIEIVGNTNNIIPFTADSYYRILNLARGSYYMAATAEMDLMGLANNATDASQIWKFEQNEDNSYNLTAQGIYICNTTNQSADVVTTKEENVAGNYIITPVTTPGYYKIEPTEGFDLHLAGVNDLQSPLKVVGWNNENGKADASTWLLIPTSTIDVTITEAGYATANYPFAVELPDGLTAYTGSIEGEKFVLSEVSNKVIPANSPVIIAGSATTHSLTILADNADPSMTTGLEGTCLSQAIDGSVNAYVLANSTNGIGFYRLTNEGDNPDRTIGQNKAYLTIAGSAGIKAFTFDFGGTTGIENTEAAVTEEEEYYDLQGRRVLNPTKGIYVTKSGKKVLFTK